MLGALRLPAPAAAQTEVLSPFVVSATRDSLAPEDLPVAADVFSGEQLAASPALTLDDALREDPAFSLFRRTSSLISNPTSQGVSLRGIGPSGASRTLVLLDGVPLNDPFGGWVAWSEVPRLSITRAAIVEGGGSGVWGNSALAGSIELIEAPAVAGGQAEAEIGAFDTRSVEVEAVAPIGLGAVSVDARDFATGGFYDLAADDRGPVDRPLDSEHRLAQINIREAISPDLEASATGRLFDEDRGNGTVLQRNSSHMGFASVQLDGTPRPDLGWDATGYAERQSFSAFFSSVSADRTTETPANDQFDVPTTAVGGALTFNWSQDSQAATVAGVDVRQVEGETREDFQYSGGAFTRDRFAGGAQDFAGIFVHQDRSLAEHVRLSFDLRFDEFENRDGHDREFSLATGAPTLLATYPAKTGTEWSPNVGLTWKPSAHLRLRAAADRAFRLPTLNEYYRPFRVGTVTTDANPNLGIETLDGGEVGADYTAGNFQFGVTGFADALYHSVGTITLSQSAAATTLERANIDAVRVDGAEASVRWSPTAAVSLRVAYLVGESLITAASAEPDLVGKQLPEVPRNTLTAGLEWHAPLAIQATARLRWVSLQFDDNANTLRLPPATVVDLELSRKFGRHLEAFLTAENLLNAQVTTSLSTTGLFTYDAPQLLRGGLRTNW